MDGCGQSGGIGGGGLGGGGLGGGNNAEEDGNKAPSTTNIALNIILAPV